MYERNLHRKKKDALKRLKSYCSNSELNKSQYERNLHRKKRKKKLLKSD